MKLLSLAIVVLISTSCFAQDAKVIVLEKADSDRLAQIYREFKDVRDFVDELEPILAETTIQERT